MTFHSNRSSLDRGWSMFGLGWVLLLFWGGGGCSTEVTGPRSVADDGIAATSVSLGETKPAFLVGNCWLAGQPQPDDFPKIAAAGVQQVISIRGENEIDWDERAAAEDAGLEYIQIPIESPDQMTDQKLAELRALLRKCDEEDRCIMLHCGAAVRAAAVWLTYHSLDQEESWEAGKQLLEDKVRLPKSWESNASDYVQRVREDDSQ